MMLGKQGEQNKTSHQKGCPQNELSNGHSSSRGYSQRGTQNQLQTRFNSKITFVQRKSPKIFTTKGTLDIPSSKMYSKDVKNRPNEIQCLPLLSFLCPFSIDFSIIPCENCKYCLLHGTSCTKMTI